MDSATSSASSSLELLLGFLQLSGGSSADSSPVAEVARASRLPSCRCPLQSRDALELPFSAFSSAFSLLKAVEAATVAAGAATAAASATPELQRCSWRARRPQSRCLQIPRCRVLNLVPDATGSEVTFSVSSTAGSSAALSSTAEASKLAQRCSLLQRRSP